MSFLLQRASGRSLTLTQVSSETLRIGRGTNQELRSENPAVALEHAVIESDVAGYFITDKGSITGTYVNRKPVETARLAKGDAIEIGDLRLEVQMADPAKPLFLRIVTTRSASGAMLDDEEEAQQVAAPGARVVRAKRYDYAAAYRLHRSWLTKLSVTALLLIVALTVIGEVVGRKKQTVFMPGGLSSAHARSVAAKCDTCHTPFKNVSSGKCLDCHPQQPHGEHELNPPDCFDCHSEHRGAAKLAALADQTCTGCHADLQKHMRPPPSQLASLKFAEGRYSFENISRVTAFGEQHPELSYPRDPNTLRFNHQLHLNAKGVRNATGNREVLQCTGCHASARGEPVVADFEQHCQRCHLLTFDARFPDAQVPHGGDPGIVYGYIGGMYSGDRELAGKSAAEVRRILTTRRRVSTDQRSVINAEQVVKTKCSKCHDIVRGGARVAVTPPVILTSWLNRARFTHGRHQKVDCEQCHEGARESAATSDVLMPRAKNCTNCHGVNARVAEAASTCVTCHLYHLRPKRQVQKASLAQAGMGGLGSGGRMLQGILLAVIVILLLVVLVPVGIALFQRLRPERAPAAPPRPKPAPVPPAPRVQVDAPTDKVVARPSVPPPDLTPQPPSPAVASTRVDLDPSKTDPPVGTEMVQWYGMLHCTQGALEGQRFIIEDQGIYIGRDPALAKIVVPDSRVSKRHVRILPRDGKVWAIDEGSTNGTFMKGQRITEVQLKRGDTLVLGDEAATFVYQI
jgi:pSer/pThr/pTyr-binding forkhead associated (FHA) protein/ribosomal protein L40E